MDKIIPPPMMSARRRRRRRLLWLLALVTALLTAFGGVAFVSRQHTITPEGIVIHHSAVTTTRDKGLPIDAEVLDALHKERGFGTFYWGRTYHIGYHYVILPGGEVQEGRPEHCQGAHTFGYNSYIGICLIGNFDTEEGSEDPRGLKEPTEAQLRSLTELTRRLRARYNISLEKVRRHSDLNSDTHCPGDRFPFPQLLQNF